MKALFPISLVGAVLAGSWVAESVGGRTSEATVQRPIADASVAPEDSWRSHDSSAATQQIQIDGKPDQPSSPLPDLSLLLELPEINPDRLVLPMEERELLEELMAEQCRRIESVKELMIEAQNAVMDERIAAGDVVPFIAGKTETRIGDSLAVNVAVEEDGIWLVRIATEEIPEWQTMVDAIHQIEDETLDQIGSVVKAYALASR